MPSTLDRVAPKIDPIDPDLQQTTPAVTPPASDSKPLGWMKDKATAVTHGLVTSVWVGGFVVGVVVVVVAAVLGFLWLANHGVLQQLLPAPPVVVQPPEAIKISMHGPSPSVVISGVTSIFTVDVTGPASTPEWQVFPPTAASVAPSPDGKRADVLAATDGKFTVNASIAGDGRQLAHARVDVEAMAQVVQQPLPPEPPVPRPPDPTPPEPPRPVAETVADRIARQLATVNSTNRGAEARKVANVITSVIGRINAGAIGPHTDVAGMIREESVRNLGPAAPQWDLFLSAIALVLDNFQNQGLITTAGSTVPVLTEIAGVLLKAQ